MSETTVPANATREELRTLRRLTQIAAAVRTPGAAEQLAGIDAALRIRYPRVPDYENAERTTARPRKAKRKRRLIEDGDVMATCEHCRGRGTLDRPGRVLCPTCHGTGKAPRTVERIDEYGRHWRSPLFAGQADLDGRALPTTPDAHRRGFVNGRLIGGPTRSDEQYAQYWCVKPDVADSGCHEYDVSAVNEAIAERRIERTWRTGPRRRQSKKMPMRVTMAQRVAGYNRRLRAEQKRDAEVYARMAPGKAMADIWERLGIEPPQAVVDVVAEAEAQRLPAVEKEDPMTAEARRRKDLPPDDCRQTGQDHAALGTGPRVRERAVYITVDRRFRPQ